jgi:pSer/pThr/pTyr-binding forkhead associated (FHA) protein
LPRLSSNAFRQGLAGALGGFLVFLVLEALGSAAGLQSGYANDDYDAWRVNVFLVGGLFGAVVTALLAAASEWWSGSQTRIVGAALAGAVVGGVLSTGYSILGNVLYDIAQVISGLFGGTLGIFARTCGWAVFGLGVGLSAGLLTRSQRRTYQGCFGGLAGGFLGGFCFDLLMAFAGGLPGRLVGYVILGTAVGLATALAEQMNRIAWLTFLTGSREGSELSLDRPETLLGRDELVDVPLFGDNAVDKRQAVLSLYPLPTIHDVGARALIRVDGQPVQSAALVDGALVEIGRHRLRFHCRDAALGPEELLNGQEVFERLVGPGAAAPTPGWARDAVAAPNLALLAGGEPTLAWSPTPSGFILPSNVESGVCLRVLSGPATGVRVPLGEHGVTLGRDESSTVPLRDARVSRLHGRIESVEGAWVYRDLGSTNGSFLNGMRILRAGLALGDELLLGDTRIAVEHAGAG